MISSSRTACWFLVSLTASAVLCGCGSPVDEGERAGQAEASSGELVLNLVGGSLTIASATYVITGPSGFVKTGSLANSGAGRVSALIGGIPVGTGFTITLSVTGTDGTTCTGAAGFSVTAGVTSSVDVALACHVAPDAGSVVIGGDVNICPVIDELSDSTGEVVLGAPVELTASAHDSDSGPAPLSYQWSASSGSLTSSGSSTTFTCTAAGVATITLVVGDGAAGCTDSQSVTIECSAVAATGAKAVPVPRAFVALLALGFLAIGLRERRRARSRTVA